MDSKDSSEIVTGGTELKARGEALRLSRLQRSGFNLDFNVDDDDTNDDDVLQESISNTVNFKKGEAETIKKGEICILIIVVISYCIGVYSSISVCCVSYLNYDD